ncbi:hypothetical protein [Pedobacter sp. SL55]|uniref:hypothetical protein n=1 Tax=Pedobacter sp. SL55 TaxID=2995161 RepID=UPI0022707FD0|nr:hypothetical protein [Pedobacter sp. SL55]WAC39348.1 hypothetical protein OVA16_12105 [Pedobacter sp. SL55]
MKKILLLLTLLLSTKSYAQTSTALQRAARDYSFAVYESFRWGSDGFKHVMITSLQRQGYYSDLAIMKGMESIDKNIKFRQATYRAWSNVANDVSILGLHLMNIGMTATNAEIMARYIVNFNNAEAKKTEDEQVSTVETQNEKAEIVLPHPSKGASSKSKRYLTKYTKEQIISYYVSKFGAEKMAANSYYIDLDNDLDVEIVIKKQGEYNAITYSYMVD